MHIVNRLALPAALIVGASCSSSSAPSPAPAPAPAPAAPAAGRAGGAPTGGAQGGRGAAGGAAAGAAAGAPQQAAGGGRGAQAQTPEQRAARRDSIAQARAAAVKELMAQIAGKENLPAPQVFKNVKVMTGVTAGQLVTAMDQGIGRALSRGCNDCHVPTDWASDSIPRKNTARTMMGIVADINNTLLPRMGPGRGGQPRTIQCVTCHRGGSAGSTALIP